MTDTHAPITGEQPAPMFDTGATPVGAPNTEPHPAPIFDTGPHPDPLQPERSDDVFAAADALDAGIDPVAADPAGIDPDGTEDPATPRAFSELDGGDTDAFLRSVTGHVGVPPPAVVATPIAVPSSYPFVKRWTFALIVAGVWVVSAAAGLGLYHWWYTALDKTLPVFGVLLFVVVCTVASLLVSMIEDRPQFSAVALALMAVPLAAMAAAAVLHGAYYFEWIARPAIG